MKVGSWQYDQLVMNATYMQLTLSSLLQIQELDGRVRKDRKNISNFYLGSITLLWSTPSPYQSNWNFSLKTLIV